MLKRVCDFNDDGSDLVCPEPIILSVRIVATEGAEVFADTCRDHVGTAVYKAWENASERMDHPVTLFDVRFTFTPEP